MWEITESEADLWKKVSLAPAELQQLQGIRHPRRRLQSLAARAARHTLPPAPFSSLSHSFPWAAALTAPYPAALDIEALRPFPAQVIPYFTCPAEQAALQTGDLTPWHIWSAKELAYKVLCSKFDQLSFRKELKVQGGQVLFTRGAVQYVLQLHFVETPEWILAIGRLDPPHVLNIEPYGPHPSPRGRR